MIISEDNKAYLSWNDINEFLYKIVRDIKQCLENPKELVIVTITRGGLIPATLLSHRLGIDRIFVVTKELFNEPIMNIPVPVDGTRLLFVDDIYDSGKTYQQMRNLLFGYKIYPCFLTMKFAPKDMPTPFFVGRTMFNSRWVVFPWEEG